MELIKENSAKLSLNIEGFSTMIGEAWDVPPDILKNYILANVSIAMIRNLEMKKAINKLYLLDKIKYYEAVKTSSCAKHVIMTEGTLQQEIEGRKALGILLIAEEDYNLRNNLISLLRKYYPQVFNAVKKHDKRELARRYLQMDEVTRKIEGRLEAAVYFYFGIYRSVDSVDKGFIKSILDDVKTFEFYDPITRDIAKEIEIHKTELQEIKAVLKRDYGKFNNYKDILNSKIPFLEELGGIVENMFITNKLDVSHLFSDSNFLNIDEILLSYVKRGNSSLDSTLILQTLVNGIFIKSLINDYKRCRTLYFENNQETLLFKIDSLEKKLTTVEEENKNLSTDLYSINQQNASFEEKLNCEINKLNKKHSSQVSEMQNRINQLENQLLEEKSYRNELNVLREYMFEVNNQYLPIYSEKTLKDYIIDKKILIIGGAKVWRRKFREKYPELKTLHGFNENFDTSILSNYDYIFFYTGFMNHATYYRAMNFIRTHQLKFGYIGKTNMDLVEEELMDQLK